MYINGTKPRFWWCVILLLKDVKCYNSHILYSPGKTCTPLPLDCQEESNSTDVPVLLLNQPNNLWKRLGNILVLGPHQHTRFLLHTMIGLFKSHCQFTNRLNGNSEYISSNSLNLLWAWNKDVGTALQTLRTRLRLYMQHGLKNKSMSIFKVQRKYRFLRALLVRE